MPRKSQKNNPGTLKLLDQVLISKNNNGSKASKSSTSSQIHSSEEFDSPYKNSLTKIQRISLNNDGDDFRTPIKIVPKIFKKQSPKKGKKIPKKIPNFIMKCTKDNFKNLDVNPEHLQMALALSKSTFAEEYPKKSRENPEPDLPSFLTPNKIPKVTTFLERYGFKSNKAQLYAETSINHLEETKRRKNSKFRFVTPVLYTRTSEERESLIKSKISVILSQKNTFNIEDSSACLENDINSPYLKKYVHEKKSWNTNNLNESNSYSLCSSLQISPTKSAVGCLLKDWNMIPGRESTENVSNLKQPSVKEQEMIQMDSTNLDDNSLISAKDIPDISVLNQTSYISLDKNDSDISINIDEEVKLFSLEALEIQEEVHEIDNVTCDIVVDGDEDIENITIKHQVLDKCYSPDLFESDDDACSLKSPPSRRVHKNISTFDTVYLNKSESISNSSKLISFEKKNNSIFNLQSPKNDKGKNQDDDDLGNTEYIDTIIIADARDSDIESFDDFCSLKSPSLNKIHGNLSKDDNLTEDKSKITSSSSKLNSFEKRNDIVSNSPPLQNDNKSHKEMYQFNDGDDLCSNDSTDTIIIKSVKDNGIEHFESYCEDTDKILNEIMETDECVDLTQSSKDSEEYVDLTQNFDEDIEADNNEVDRSKENKDETEDAAPIEVEENLKNSERQERNQTIRHSLIAKRSTLDSGNASCEYNSTSLNITDYIMDILNSQGDPEPTDSSIEDDNDILKLQGCSQMTCSQESIVVSSDEELNYSSKFSAQYQKDFYNLSTLDEDTDYKLEREKVDAVHLELKNKYCQKKVNKDVVIANDLENTILNSNTEHCNVLSPETEVNHHSGSAEYSNNSVKDNEENEQHKLSQNKSTCSEESVIVLSDEEMDCSGKISENDRNSDEYVNTNSKDEDLEAIHLELKNKYSQENDAENKSVENKTGNTIQDNSNDSTTEKTRNNKITPSLNDLLSNPDKNLIIKTRNVTPKPDYDAMDTPKIVAELDKFGIKPLKRRRGVQLLEYIYETTHPIVNMDDVEYELNEDIEERPIKRRKLSNQFEKIDKQNIEIVGTVLIENEKEDDLLFERKISKKIPSCRIPLQIVWYNFVCSNPKLNESIILYEPIQLEVIHSMLKEQTGCNFHVEDLTTFLDKKCITFRTNQWQGSRKKVKEKT